MLHLSARISDRFAAVAAAVCAIGLPAQEKAQEKTKELKVEVSVTAITIAVTVQDRSGRFVTDLTREGFFRFRERPGPDDQLFQLVPGSAVQPDHPARREREHGPPGQAQGVQRGPSVARRIVRPAAGRDLAPHFRRRTGRGGLPVLGRQSRLPQGPGRNGGLRADRPQRRRGRFPRIRESRPEREAGHGASDRRDRERQSGDARLRPWRSPGGWTCRSMRSDTRSP